jgi:two-component system, NtrC family, sensor histidine kinase HydH
MTQMIRAMTARLMGAVWRRSLVRTFALLSLITIAVITSVQVGVQWALLRRDLLEWERMHTAATIRSEALSALRADDFDRWNTPEAQERFARFFRVTLFNAEVLRVKIYGRDMTVIWSDEPQLLGTRSHDNAPLERAMAGETVAFLRPLRRSENAYERGFGQTVELYVPIAWSAGSTPGTARIVGVVEIYKDPARMLSNIVWDRWIVIATSVAGALVLYGALSWIVARAARDLERQADALRTTNAELRATQEQLRASERLAAIGEVSAAVAHGFRNPLANVRACAQVALDQTTEPASGYLRTITAEVDRLGAWLQAMLDYVRPFQLNPKTVDVNAVVTDLLETLRPRLGSGQVVVDRKLAPDLPAITADEALLQQALLGILENAIDAVRTGGTLVVETGDGMDEGRAVVYVAIGDNGEGIRPDRLAHIFDPFFTTKSRGTGLGLAITRKVIDQHRGRIEVQSQIGLGTTMRVTLPAADGQSTS